eukprot:symbB.v1.2.039758.t1/scaffold6768.1/size18901/1
MTASCRPIHGGYPQPADWSAWPWCTDSFVGNLGGGHCSDDTAMQTVNHLKRVLNVDAYTQEDAVPKRHCGVKVTIPTRKRSWEFALQASSG